MHHVASEPEDQPVAQRRRWWRIAAMILGFLLIASAIVVAIRQQDAIASALDAIRSPSIPHLALLLGGIAANIFLTGCMFSVLMSRYGKTGFVEMQALIASATLLNFLPLRPGLFGRVAYHKAYNNILAVHSIKAIVEASIISTGIVAFIGVALIIAGQCGISPWWGAAVPAPILLGSALNARLRLWTLAGFVRYLEVLVWAARYWAAFALIGQPVDATAALAFACISMMATFIPFVSNGLGLREWAIGLTAPLLAGYQLELGITAELVNRAAELVIIVVVGLIGVSYLAYRRRCAGPPTIGDA